MPKGAPSLPFAAPSPRSNASVPRRRASSVAAFPPPGPGCVSHPFLRHFAVKSGASHVARRGVTGSWCGRDGPARSWLLPAPELGSARAALPTRGRVAWQNQNKSREEKGSRAAFLRGLAGIYTHPGECWPLRSREERGRILRPSPRHPADATDLGSLGWRNNCRVR